MRHWIMVPVWMLVCGCGVVDLGDNIVAPMLHLDEDFFYCEIQPNVISTVGCAAGMGAEAGSCHADRSSLRLRDIPVTMPPDCTNDVLNGMPAPNAHANLEALRFTVQSDPLSSPLYRRPTGMDNHPNRPGLPGVIAADSMEAMLIEEWIQRATM